jgi:hypothetical protein
LLLRNILRFPIRFKSTSSVRALFGPECFLGIVSLGLPLVPLHDLIGCKFDRILASLCPSQVDRVIDLT